MIGRDVVDGEVVECATEVKLLLALAFRSVAIVAGSISLPFHFPSRTGVTARPQHKRHAFPCRAHHLVHELQSMVLLAHPALVHVVTTN